MDLRFNEDQTMIREAARDFLSNECPLLERRSGAADREQAARALWEAMASLGWQGLAVPEAFGGSGLGLQELCILLEEQGRVALAGPFFTTTVHCGLAIIRYGTEAQRQAWLPRLAAGQCRLSYAAAEAEDPWRPERPALRARVAGDGYRLSGRKLFVPHAAEADGLLVVAGLDGGEETLGLFLLECGCPGLAIEPLGTLGEERQYRVEFDQVAVSADALLGGCDRARGWVAMIEQWGALGRCAEMVGGAERVLELSREYACERRAFGKRIGSFQAIQHHCANMATDVLSSRLLTYEAAWRLASGQAAALEVAAAKAWVSDAYQRVCALGHQVHGAIGFTGEHPMPRFFRHAKALALAHGDGAWHRTRVARTLGL